MQVVTWGEQLVSGKLIRHFQRHKATSLDYSFEGHMYLGGFL